MLPSFDEGFESYLLLLHSSTHVYFIVFLTLVNCLYGHPWSIRSFQGTMIWKECIIQITRKLERALFWKEQTLHSLVNFSVTTLNKNEFLHEKYFSLYLGDQNGWEAFIIILTWWREVFPLFYFYATDKISSDVC